MINKKTIIFLSFFFVFIDAKALQSQLDSILTILNEAIVHNEYYINEKQQRIDDIKKMLTIPNITLGQQYDINRRLYHEYKPFISDSAIVYAKKNIRIAETLKDDLWKYEAMLNLSMLYSVSGMQIDAMDIQTSIPVNKLPDWLKIYYYEAYKELYNFYPPTSDYHVKNNLYRDSILMIADPASMLYGKMEAETIHAQGRDEEAREIYIRLFSESDKESPWYAKLAYSIGTTYQREHNYDMQKKYYALSAISDLRNATKQNASLRELAIVFYETGDIESAYKYIQQSMEDAIFSNAYFRRLEIADFLPVIEKLYQEKIKVQNKNLEVMNVIIGIISLCLAFAVVYVYLQMRKLSKAKKTLHDINGDLQELNGKITIINGDLSESNHLKEEYIARYMDQSSSYLEQLEEYRKNLNRIAAKGNLEELYKALKSRQFIEDEIREFYHNFDKSFLELFPTFVEDFNALLEKEERVIPKPKELLNTELRIFALIRLGITDSAKIARFLRSPASTIYTYRTKIRKKAMYDKEKFEELVMRIGTDSLSFRH